MFERYTEHARRVLFFSRYEASQLGSTTIASEHVLLGLLREGKGLSARLLAGLAIEQVRSAIMGEAGPRTLVSTAVEIPFSSEAKRALQFAAEESDRLLHNYIGTEHLLLGVLREAGSLPVRLLGEHGVTLEGTRARIVELLNEKSQGAYDAGQVVPAQLTFSLVGPPEGQVNRLVAVLRHMATCLEHPDVKGDGDEAARARVARLLEGLKGVIASMDAGDR
jgi:ATP-dependent Clp protease ATP-binding subunit ClpA